MRPTRPLMAALRVLQRSPRTRLLGTPEHCDQVTASLQVVKTKPVCIAGVARGAELGARGRLDTLIPGVQISTVVTEALRPHRSLPLHHDDWNEALGTEAWSYEKPVTDELTKIPAERRPRVSWLFDPTDYLADGVRSYDPASRAYRTDFPEPALSQVPRLEDKAFVERYARAHLLLPAVNCSALAAAQLRALPGTVGS